jgi:hypothetical protein
MQLLERKLVYVPLNKDIETESYGIKMRMFWIVSLLLHLEDRIVNIIDSGRNGTIGARTGCWRVAILGFGEVSAL